MLARALGERARYQAQLESELASADREETEWARARGEKEREDVDRARERGRGREREHPFPERCSRAFHACMEIIKIKWPITNDCCKEGSPPARRPSWFT